MKLTEQQQKLKEAAKASLQVGDRWPDSVEKVNRIAQWGIQDAEFIALCSPAAVLALLVNEPCEACERNYRLAVDGLHYDDERGGATWGVCRKVTSALS